MNDSIVWLDCTMRDGGYYNNWDFPKAVIDEYMAAMSAAKVDFVELGLRSLSNTGFKGPCAFTTDEFLRSLTIPPNLKVAVMVNASELLAYGTLETALQKLFPQRSDSSPVSLVRIACHVHEFAEALPASGWLKELGFLVGFNLMQVADRSEDEIRSLSRLASKWPIDALYFADSMGSMAPDDTANIIRQLRTNWDGALGVHTHDNLGLALQNTLRALDEGVTWVDSTVTGMGRGPGNAKTEYLALEIPKRRSAPANIVPLMSLVRETFAPMQRACGWGTNAYYYLAGKHGIHPSYIQEMLGDNRYSEEDILAVIEHLRENGGKKFSLNTLDAARHFYIGAPRGTWRPETVLKDREVLLLGTGPGVAAHKVALEAFILKTRPYVLALNTQSQIDAQLIDARVASHPVRLLADCEVHARLTQPLITPASMLPEDVRSALDGKELFDFGLGIADSTFAFGSTHATTPSSLVIAYALAIAASGRAKRINLAGFDGYQPGDKRNVEMNKLLGLFLEQPDRPSLRAVTPTCYDVPISSIYGSLEG